MNRHEALKQLRINEDLPTSATVAKAFQRLATRYPAASFPDLHTKLLTAYQVLSDEKGPYLSILTEKRVDLSLLETTRQSTSALKEIITDEREFGKELVRLTARALLSS